MGDAVWQSVLIILQNKPIDWVLGHPLDTETIRTMQDDGILDHHHIFPVSYMKECATKEEINHGLNGTLLEKTGNISLGNDAPEKYLEKILDQSSSLDEAELRERVESHLVPYDTLKATGEPQIRNICYLSSRELCRLLMKSADSRHLSNCKRVVLSARCMMVWRILLPHTHLSLLCCVFSSCRISQN